MQDKIINFKVMGDERGSLIALEENNNIPFDVSLYYEGDYRETGGSNGLKHLINNNKNFTALICANDEMASGSMTYAREHGFSLPNDLSIIGFDNNNFARHTYPKLTTIDNPVNEMGKMAAKLVLQDVYKQKDLSIKHFFEPTLIIRDSVVCKT